MVTMPLAATRTKASGSNAGAGDCLRDRLETIGEKETAASDGRNLQESPIQKTGVRAIEESGAHEPSSRDRRGSDEPARLHA